MQDIKLTATPTDALTQDLIDSLPSLIREGANTFSTMHEKTIFVYSALSACSGLLTNGFGKYYQRKIYPNLFFILSAPAAAGKSSLTSAYDLLYPIHLEYLNKSLQAKQVYKRQSMDKSNKKACIERPPFKTVLIPGNISSSRLIQHLSDNEPDVPSVIVLSELDTLTQANKSDFGGFSDTLRAAFHNEKISLSRKGNDEFVEIRQPKLSLIASGTPKQVFKLIPSAEDGLYSRCMFYSFNPEMKWMDVGPDGDMSDISTVMGKLSKEVYNFWKFFKGRSVEFMLSKSQWDILNTVYGDKLNDLASIGGNASISVLKRNAVVCFKLAMVLSALRAYEFGMLEKSYECYDRDFKAAITLAQLSLDRSLNLLEQLPDGELLTSRKEKKEAFKKSLPTCFTSQEAIELSKSLIIGERSVYRWLDEWVKEKFLTREAHGIYKCQ